MTPDLIIVGAGPAGVSAAIEGRARGLAVLLLDENGAPGGRIWQALEARGAKDADDTAALRTLGEFRASGADARWRASVWAIDPDGTVFWSDDRTTHSARGGFVLLATGTTERPLAIPGWTLPGVMTVGAAQIALKTSGLVPSGACWIAGQGPLLMLYAVQALRAGGRLAGILDLSDRGAVLPALRHLPGALPAFADLRKGLAWRWEIARAGVKWIRASDLRAEGDGALSRIRFRAGGQDRSEPADLLLLHDGVMPSVQITRALGCAHEWDEAQRCWKPVTDAWGVTSNPRLLVAGDGAGVGGALAAACAGRLAALGAASALGRIDAASRDTAAEPLRAARARYLASRPFLDALYAPRAPSLDDNTMVCRCEEVTAGQIRQAAKIGALGLNQLKAFTRCGMGPCQGRMCGATAAEVMADARGVPLEQIEPYRTRFPTRPLTLGELAALDVGT
ncbi:MAG: FAD-dependent oxidoreductase [Acetobacteraceae bacterium]|nr:FAD-dependent oxidoreductase [Acetobacteraceae bacterium]